MCVSYSKFVLLGKRLTNEIITTIYSKSVLQEDSEEPSYGEQILFYNYFVQMLSIRVIVARFYFVKNIFHIFDVTIN